MNRRKVLQGLAGSAALGSPLGAWLTPAAALAARDEGRDPWLWPFASDSPWNTPIGSGAQYAGDNDPITLDVIEGGDEIKAGKFSHPIYLAKEGDPIRSIYDKENLRTFQFPIPADAKPDPKGDGHMYVVSPDRTLSMEMYRTKFDPDGRIVTNRCFQVDLYGSGMQLKDGSKFPGVRAMDASGMGGILRVWEIEAQSIRHALTFLLNWSKLKHVEGRRPGWGGTWPSNRNDYWGHRDYKGNVPIGTLIAIPASIDITRLGLNSHGLALARCLQDYGAYCDDSKNSFGISLSAEGASEGHPGLQKMRLDLGKLHPLLRPVLNNTERTPGGGGTPRRPPAPPLMPKESFLKA
ncbi:MAG TPA: hypothetical protein VJM11_07715 [Nevskiaceae bacterium]|nr:hypothetical protein [Nevskiaceae bacterium]